ncbi:MAG: hypothetical protein ACXW3X_07695 [Rhodoplanes sp.]
MHPLRGESFEAWDVLNRYTEHMQRQRAAAAAARSQPEASDDE